jgi:hypothetical protein
MLCNAALMVRLLNFYSSFKQNFFSNFLLEFQVVRESNRSTFEGSLYIYIYIYVYSYISVVFLFAKIETINNRLEVNLKTVLLLVIALFGTVVLNC